MRLWRSKFFGVLTGKRNRTSHVVIPSREDSEEGVYATLFRGGGRLRPPGRAERGLSPRRADDGVRPHDTQERGRDAAALDAAGAAMGSIGLLIFAVTVWLLLPNHSAWAVLSGASVLWFVSSCCLWFLREHRHKVFGFEPNAKHVTRVSRS